MLCNMFKIHKSGVPVTFYANMDSNLERVHVEV